MITVVIPTLNEEAHIADLLRQVAGEGGAELLEVIVADGGSTDATCGIVQAMAVEDSRVRLLHNPARLQSAAMNLAVAQADGRCDIIVRLDAHAAYPAGFVADVARVLRQTGADSVVVRLLSCGTGCFQRAVAAVSNSRLGSGGSVHRVGGESRWIDHGHHAGFRRESFQRMGGYDPAFSANEDGDYDDRLVRSGGRIWFAADLEIRYFPRDTVRGLARQYYRNGLGRAQNLLKNGGRPKLRQLAPVAILAGVATGVGLAPLTHGVSLALPAAYFGACAVAGAALAMAQRSPCLLGAALALPAMHLSWAAGLLVQLARRGGGGMALGRPARQEV